MEKWTRVGVSKMTTTEKEIIEEIRKNMISIAKPYLIDSQADPFIKEAAKTLLIRIENEESWVGKLIIGIMNISHVEGIKAGREQGEIIGRLLCANESHKELEEENKDKGIKQGRKQLAEEILIDSRLNSQINEAGIRLILKEKLQKEAEK